MFPRNRTRVASGIDIGKSVMRLVEVRQQSGSLLISKALTLDPSESIPCENVPVITAVNDRDLVTKTLTIRPGLGQAALETLVTHEVQKHFLRPRRDLLVDFYVRKSVSNQQPMLDLVIFATTKTQHLVNINSLESQCIDIESHALARAIRTLGEVSDATVLLIWFKDKAIQFIRIRAAEHQLLRDDSYHNETDCLDKVNAFLLSDRCEEPAQCYLAGDYDQFEALTSFIRQSTGWIVSMANPLTLVNTAAMGEIDAQGASYLLAFGLALRGGDYESH